MDAKTTTNLYAVRTEASSATVVMSSQYLAGLMWLWFAVYGAVFIGAGIKALFTPYENWPEFNYNWPGFLFIFVIGLLFVVAGGWSSSSVIDLRSITLTRGRATVTWRLFRRSIRSLTFNVRCVVIQQDLWRNGRGSTDRVVLECQEKKHTVATLWNIPPTRSFKPPLNWRLGAGSEFLARRGVSDERAVSPVIFDLAKALAGAASVPIVVRVGETRGPWVTIGGH
jgi:hypothetical protein